MKITVLEDSGLDETEVVIHCSKADSTVAKIISALSAIEHRLTGVKDGRTYILEPDEVLYFESVDKRTFCYTRRDIYEVFARLYELEERMGTNFIRVSKSAVVNIRSIASILPDFGGRLELTLKNEERLLVSRQYAQLLKSRIGL